MTVVIQRVTAASVAVAGEVIGKIGKGLVVFVGVAHGDTDEDISYLVEKTINLRIFADTEGKFNLSALDVGAGLLLVTPVHPAREYPQRAPARFYRRRPTRRGREPV